MFKSIYKIINMQVSQFEPIYCLDKNNKIKIWYAKIFQEETTNQVYVIVYHGYLNGKIQENKTIYSKGKNMGKKNETTPYQQCLQETKKNGPINKKKKIINCPSTIYPKQKSFIQC